MPLDTGAFAEGTRAGREAQARRPKLTLDAGVDIGSAMRAVRQSLGLSLDQISESTRVRVRHLAAIEAGQTDQLPSRPFTIGYVRAYAQALGLDVDATAARFRTEYPSPDDELHSPVGVRHNKPKSFSGWMLAVPVALVLAVVGWNVALRVMSATAPKPPAVAPSHAVEVASVNAATGAFSLHTPLPAPPEATPPPPYITPVAGSDAANAVAAVKTPIDAAATPFVASGAVYGPASGASTLIIQAKKSISLEVRGPGNVVYFARQLAPGEAYRVPALPGLTAEVSNPENAELFEGGLSKGALPQAQTPLKTVG